MKHFWTVIKKTQETGSLEEQFFSFLRHCFRRKPLLKDENPGSVWKSSEKPNQDLHRYSVFTTSTSGEFGI